MGETSITVEATTETTIDTEELSTEIGRQLILDSDEDVEPFAYLAGIAFDGMNGNHDPVDIMIEFVENSHVFDLEEHEIRTIEQLLRDAYED